MSNQLMSTHVIPYLTCLTRTIMALILVGMVCLSVPSQGLAYKIEIGVSGPIGGDSVTEENGRTEIKLDTGPVIGPDGEAGSAFALSLIHISEPTRRTPIS